MSAPDARLANDKAEAEEDDDAKDGARARHEDAQECPEAVAPLPRVADGPLAAAVVVQQQHIVEAAAARPCTLQQSRRQRAGVLAAGAPKRCVRRRRLAPAIVHSQHDRASVGRG